MNVTLKELSLVILFFGAVTSLAALCLLVVLDLSGYGPPDVVSGIITTGVLFCGTVASAYVIVLAGKHK